MDFDVFSAGEISWRNAQSTGDVIELICVDGHLADNSSRALPCNDSSHSFLRCYRPRSGSRPPTERQRDERHTTLTRIAFTTSVFDPEVV